MNPDHLDRRTAMRRLAAGAAGAAAATWVESLTALGRAQAHAHTNAAAMAAQAWTPRILTPRQNEAVIALTELIIPQTDTPGAKAALVNRFIDGVLADAPPGVRERFIRGLGWIDRRSRTLTGKDFVDATPDDQTALLTNLSGEGSKEDRTGVEFFNAIKTMTIDGYYTTEIGLAQELGDDGQLFLPEFKGCDHPEHQ